MPRAQCSLPDGPNYHRAEFAKGLRAAGYEVVPRVDHPAPGDALVIWNRTASRELEARRFEYGGARVLVCENGYLGKTWRGQKWFSMAWDHHLGAGTWPDGGIERWDAWGVELSPWRDGPDTLILAQRGIGEPGIASPVNWARDVQSRIGGRIRQHPGSERPEKTLKQDLQGVGAVVTYHSAAALQALILGVPVWYDFPQWIGAAAGRPLSEFGAEPLRDDTARIEMLQRLAWAMWSVDEVRSGDAFRSLACMC